MDSYDDGYRAYIHDKHVPDTGRDGSTCHTFSRPERSTDPTVRREDYKRDHRKARTAGPGPVRFCFSTVCRRQDFARAVSRVPLPLSSN
jgi:hypothetical protein